jgi:hypothetical protein
VACKPEFGVEFCCIMQADHVFEKNDAMESVVRIYETALLISVSQNTPIGVTNSRYKIPISITAYRYKRYIDSVKNILP